MDATPLSERDLARLKAGRSQATALQRVAAEWRRPAPNWGETLHQTGVAVLAELKAWQEALPALFRGDFIFTLALWVAVYSVAAVVVALPSIPLPVRYGTGLAALGYLYLYAELARVRRPVPGRRVILTAADLGIAATLGALSAPYVGYAHFLLFVAAARVAARSRDARLLPAGLLMLVPVELLGHAAPVAVVFDGFGVLLTMLLVMQLTAAVDAARQALQRQHGLATVVSGLARARDEEGLFAQLASQAPTLAPDCAWAFWVKEPASDEFRAVRWAGLPDGELPGFAFTPTLGSDPTEAVLIDGPLPGTSFGTCTLIQPAAADGALYGLITVAGSRGALDLTARSLVRSIGAETGATLARLEALDDQRRRTEAMEQANRLAGLAAPYAGDQGAGLNAVLPAVRETLRSESLHLEWAYGDRLAVVVGSGDPIYDHAPKWLPLAGTRTAESLDTGRGLREPMTGRRPEDLFFVPVGLRQVAVVPLRCGEVEGTLQLARRLPRTYAAGELLVLQLLAERLGLLFAAGFESSVVNSSGVGGNA